MRKKKTDTVPNNSFTELSNEATCAKITQVQTKGQCLISRDIEFYNLIEINELSDSSVSSILEPTTHPNNRLSEDSVCAKIAHTADDNKVTAELAKAFAEREFEKYRIVQDRNLESDFDKMIKKIEKPNA